MNPKIIKPNAVKVKCCSFRRALKQLTKVNYNQLRTSSLSVDIFKSANNTNYNPRIGA